MTTKNKKGFTIIEVVLVLAIAGLIFLMVFIALPALQRSQRNTQREDDMARILTAVNDYQTNNNGKTPFNVKGGGVLNTFVMRYIDSSCKETTKASGYTDLNSCGSEFTDPDGQIYKIRYVGQTSKTENLGDIVSKLSETGNNGGAFDHTFYAFTNASCGDEGQTVLGTGERQIALFFVMEGGAIACNDNH